MCPYCDFAVEVGEPPDDRYCEAILDEFDRRADRFSGPLASIYLGGGTPSLWRPDCIARVVGAVIARLGTPREVTIEANPTDCTDERLAAWRAAGITRVSIGVQSLVADELVVLGRDHRFGDGAAAIERTIAAGFATSADFILGVPLGRSRSADRDWLTTRSDHLSVYELTIEPATAFGRRVRDGRLVPLDEDELTARYIATHDRLVADGYEHYEISSYARPGARAVHNSLYWRGSPYLGLGVGAASLWIGEGGDAVRTTNPRRADDYFATPGQPAESIAISRDQMAADRAWLGLRTSDGVDEGALAGAPGVSSWLVDHQFAERRGGRICPTLRGFLFADRIAARIVQSWGVQS